jgi:phage gpG-like protein
MRQFPTASAFTAFLSTATSRINAAEKAGLETAAVIVETEAKALIGTEYEAWPSLADSTVEQKERRGQTGRISSTDPLYATGELRASISHEVEGHAAVIGTPDPVGLYQEMGTSRIPPRPFLASALHRKAEDAAKAIGLSVARAIAGMRPLKGD